MYNRRMDRDYWTKALREAERELEAATRRSDVDAAARRVQRAKAALKALEAGTARPKRPARRGSRAGGDSS